MNVSMENVMWVIGAAVGVATTLFHFAFYLGRLTNEVKDAHKRIDRIDEELGDLQFGRRASDHRHGAGA